MHFFPINPQRHQDGLGEWSSECVYSKKFSVVELYRRQTVESASSPVGASLLWRGSLLPPTAQQSPVLLGVLRPTQARSYKGSTQRLSLRLLRYWSITTATTMIRPLMMSWIYASTPTKVNPLAITPRINAPITVPVMRDRKSV